MRDMLEILLSALGHPASPYQDALLIGSLSSSGHLAELRHLKTQLFSGFLTVAGSPLIVIG